MDSLILNYDNIPVVKEFYALGTVIGFKLYGKRAEEAIKEAAEKLMDIDDRMSVFKEDSEISQINKNAAIKPVKVSGDTFGIINSAVYYSKLSKGIFDITVRPVMDLWGIRRNDIVPEEKVSSRIQRLVDYRDILIDEEEKTVMLQRPNQKLDLGSIAKGFAADEIKKILDKNEVPAGILDLGGNVYVHGLKPDGDKFRIGFQAPFETVGQFALSTELSDRAAVTTGVYERYFKKDSKLYHHVMDTRTGRPCENGILSAAVIADTSMEGDALSTCAFVMGYEEGKKFLKSFGAEGIWMDSKNRVFATDGIKESIKIENSNYKLM